MKKLNIDKLLYKTAMYEKIASDWHMPEEDYKRYLGKEYKIGDVIVPVSEYPELHFKGVPAGPLEHHPENFQSVHNDLVVQRALDLMKTNPAGQYAALVHDLGKGVTDPTIWPKQHSHEQLGVPLVETMSKKLNVPDLWNKLGKFMSANHLRVHQALGATDKAVRRIISEFKSEVGDDRALFESFLIACKADAQGRLGKTEEDYPQKDKLLKAWDDIVAESSAKRSEIIAIDGSDLILELGLTPGRQVGMILSKIKEYAKNNPEQNNKEDLLNYAKTLL